MAIRSIRASGGQLTVHGKRSVALSMYSKGKAFLGAAILLRKRGGYEYVVLHLLCQGVEIALKAMLLLRDYDAYKPKLKKPLGHNLEKLVETAVKEFGLNALRPTLDQELRRLNSLYSGNLLRYGSFHDVLVDPRTIGSDRVLRASAAALRLCDRSLRAAGAI